MNQAPRKLTALFGLLLVALLGLMASATGIRPMSATDLAFADDTQPNRSIELSQSILVESDSDLALQSRGQQYVLINGSLGSGGGTLQSSLYQMEGSLGEVGASELNSQNYQHQPGFMGSAPFVATATATATPTHTLTGTATVTKTSTPTNTPTASHSATATSTVTLGPSLTPTNTPTATDTAIATITATDTGTNTPTPTNTAITSTPTPTNTAITSTPTPTNTPDPDKGSPSEPNDSCDQALPISANGRVQSHRFHDEADEDWFSFQATEAISVVIEARVPPFSRANVVLEVYDSCQNNDGSFSSDPPSNPDIRLTFSPPASGTYYLRLLDNDPTTYGEDVTYHLSVRTMQDNISSGAVILVAGRLRENDDLQDNIHYVSNGLYQFATTHGCTPEQITYLATDTTLHGVTGLPTRANLAEAITEWAVDKVGPERALTLYLIDHGDYDLLYLDEPNEERITPLDLDGWLDQLQAKVPSVAVNVVVEACYAGSFIDDPKSVSESGRVVISSTSKNWWAYASQDGATFSDSFLGTLMQGTSLYSAFEEGQWAAQQGHPQQEAWLDDDGDGAYTALDGLAAAQRQLTCAPIAPGQNWPPNISQVELRNLEGNQGEIWAKVQDDNQVRWVWAVVYPPSYQAPKSGNEMIAQPQQWPLQREADGWYSLDYRAFDESGTYRIVLYAQDHQGLQSRPQEMQVQSGWALYLPMLLR